MVPFDDARLARRGVAAYRRLRIDSSLITSAAPATPDGTPATTSAAASTAASDSASHG